MPEALTDVRQISYLAYGFMISKALFAALNIELFGHLAAGPVGLTALARATGVAENGLDTLLATLVSVGLVSRQSGAGDGDAAGTRYANSPAAARYLVPGATAYFGDYYRFQIDRQIYPNMLSLDAGLAGDGDGLAHQSMSGWLAGSAEAADFSRAQHAGSAGPALMMAKAVDFSGTGRLLDVAGGTGAYAIALCRQQPELRATIIDFPSVIEVARGFVDDAGLGQRIALIAGDALTTEWPDDQGAVLMSYLLSAVGGGDIPGLLAQAWAALRPGGLLVLHDFMLDDDRSGPVSAAAFFLTYLAVRTDPVSFSAAELARQVEAAGFVAPEAQVMIPEITKVLTARKPA